MTDLQQVLREATAHVDAPDLAGRALDGAHRRRVRRTAAGALAAVVLLGGAATWAVQDRVPHADVVDTPGPVPDPSEQSDPVLDALVGLPTPPPVADGDVQDPWDPPTAPDLPAADVGLPAVLEAPDGAPVLGSMPPAVAMVVGADGLELVDATGGWHVLELPEPLLEVPAHVRTSRLSADGTRVVVLGRTAMWSRDVRSTGWREVAYPDGFLQLDRPVGRRMLPQLLPLVAEDVLLARGTWWRVDLDRATADVVAAPEGAIVWGGGDVFVASAVDSDYAIRTLGVGPIGAPPQRFRTDALQSLTGLAASADSLAAVRAVGAYGLPKAPTERTGLIALRLDDLSTRAYLPVRDPSDAMGDGGLMRAEAWLDEDTVLASVAPVGVTDDTTERTLFTWHVGTGELRRVSTVAEGTAYDVAWMALAGQPPPLP